MEGGHARAWSLAQNAFVWQVSDGQLTVDGTWRIREDVTGKFSLSGPVLVAAMHVRSWMSRARSACHAGTQVRRTLTAVRGAL